MANKFQVSELDGRRNSKSTHHLHNCNRFLYSDDLIKVLYVDGCEVVTAKKGE